MNLEDYADMYAQAQEELEICPVCGCAMSDEEYKKNYGICYPCGDKLKGGF